MQTATMARRVGASGADAGLAAKEAVAAGMQLMRLRLGRGKSNGCASHGKQNRGVSQGSETRHPKHPARSATGPGGRSAIGRSENPQSSVRAAMPQALPTTSLPLCRGRWRCPATLTCLKRFSPQPCRSVGVAFFL